MRFWIVGIAMALAACSAPAQPPSTPQAAQGQDGVPAPLAWSADLVAGGQLDGSSLAGGDVVLWFWAPW